MPELPEMENYRIQLQQLIMSKNITAVEVNREKSVNLPVAGFTEQVLNQSITRIERYGKALFLHLSSGEMLFLHLMLGGKLYFGAEEEAPDHSKQVILSFSQKRLFFMGLRLGYLHLITPDDYQDHIKKLGPDALSKKLASEVFVHSIKKKRGAIKTVLTDQKALAGIGNRYSDEICFAAACDPRRKTADLSTMEAERLYTSMHHVLKEAIQFGGYMDMPLFQEDHVTGGYLEKMKVHGREGEPCPRCGTPIEMVEITSKKTYFCPNCQG